MFVDFYRMGWKSEDLVRVLRILEIDFGNWWWNCIFVLDIRDVIWVLWRWRLNIVQDWSLSYNGKIAHTFCSPCFFLDLFWLHSQRSNPFTLCLYYMIIDSNIGQSISIVTTNYFFFSYNKAAVKREIFIHYWSSEVGMSFHFISTRRSSYFL